MVMLLKNIDPWTNSDCFSKDSWTLCIPLCCTWERHYTNGGIWPHLLQRGNLINRANSVCQYVSIETAEDKNKKLQYCLKTGPTAGHGPSVRFLPDAINRHIERVHCADCKECTKDHELCISGGETTRAHGVLLYFSSKVKELTNI